MKKIMNTMALLLIVTLVVTQGGSRIMAAELTPETETQIMTTEETVETPTEEGLSEEPSSEEPSEGPSAEESSTTPSESESVPATETEPDDSATDSTESVEETTEENTTEVLEEIETETEAIVDQVSGNAIVSSVSSNSLPIQRLARSTDNTWDLSEKGDGSVTGTFNPENGDFRVTGSGPMKPFYDPNAEVRPYISILDDVRTLIVEDGVTNVASRMLWKAKSLVDVTLADSVTEIGDYAFMLCTALQNVKADGVTSLKKSAFHGCTALNDLILPNVIRENSSIIYAHAKTISMPKLEVSEGFVLSGVQATRIELPNLREVSSSAGKKFGQLNADYVDLSSLRTTHLGDFDQSNIGTLLLGGDSHTAIFSKSCIDKLILPEAERIDAYVLLGCATTELSDDPVIKEIIVPKLKYYSNSYSYGKLPVSNQVEKLDIPEGVIFGSYTLEGSKITFIDLPAFQGGYGMFKGHRIDTNVLDISKVIACDAGLFYGLTGNIPTVTYSSEKPLKLDFKCIPGLKSIYWLGGIHADMAAANIPSTVMVYCLEDSPVETWCKNNSVAFKNLSDADADEIINGKSPSLTVDSFLIDASAPKDVNLKVSLGVKPAGASGIGKVLIENTVIPADSWIFNGTDTITIKGSCFSALVNGSHSISVEFDNGTYRTGITANVVNSTSLPDGEGGITTPPEALTTITYEFYKDYPDSVIIPVKLNSAKNIVRLRIGAAEVDPSNYELQDGALCIKKECLMTLEVGKHRILPTFDDPQSTTIPNLMLYVYNKAADRAAPYLLQSHHIFDGSNIRMQFNVGEGDLKATNVLALVLDNKMILPNGDTKSFNQSTVSEVQNVNASAVFRSLARTQDYDKVFSVNGDNIDLSGEYVQSLKLSAGDHLIGAIFDNTEKTTDVKKVILTVKAGESEPGMDPEPEKPEVDPEPDPGKPDLGDISKPNQDPPKDVDTGDKGSSNENEDTTIDTIVVVPAETPSVSGNDVPESDSDSSTEHLSGSTESNAITKSIDRDNYKPVENSSSGLDSETVESTLDGYVETESSVSTENSNEEELKVRSESFEYLFKQLSGMTYEDYIESLKRSDTQCGCNCLCWTKVILAIFLLTVGNTASMYVAFGILIPCAKKKKAEEE